MSEAPPTASSLSGKQLAAQLRASAAESVSALAVTGVTVRLAIVTATQDESSAWYVRSIATAASKVGIETEIIDLTAQAEPGQIEAALTRLSADDDVHGIIVQTPLPPGARAEQLALSIDPAKDVDGANPLSLGRLTVNLAAFAPATAQAVLQLLDFHGIELSGRRAVVVGRSAVVGKPLVQLLLRRDATVTVCHSRTRDLPAVTREADVLVAAVGRAGLITADYIRPGGVVIDVGTNPTPDGGLTGDVDAESAAAVAGALSPVPGGVGPVTTAQLLLNTATAASQR
jgi:methylenetetrahydrofolate dehydrogenase (NADP+) / methenyltetrahydrofolate cyclohydrolase